MPPEPGWDRVIVPRRLPAWAVILSALLSLLGLWISLQYCLAIWGTDADVADTVMLWWGVQRHGLSFLASWYYTQDNWLLSLVPLAFLQFAIVGVKPFFVVVSGWAIFVGCIALSLLIARRMAGLWACLALAPFLLLCNATVVGRLDFFGYPVTHNISLLWGLLALVVASRWVASGGLGMLAAVPVVLTLDGISDPWSKAAFLAPMLIAALLCCIAVRNAAVRIRLCALAAVVVLAGVLCQTKLFGWLGFLPKDELLRADWAQANANAVALVHTFGAMFSPFPGVVGPWPITDGAVCVLLGVMLAAALSALVRRWRSLDPARLFSLSVMLLSIGGVSAAFLIGVFPDLAVAGRFFLNAYVFLPIVICAGLAVAGSEARVFRVCAIGLAGLVMLSGAASQPSAWLRRDLRINTKGTVALAAFLNSHGLHYGYGPYWATQSNAVSWVSGGQVLIRPVAFNPRTGRIVPLLAQTSPLWYEPPEAGTASPSFVIVASDGENCGKVEVCVTGVTGQFGPPARTLAYQDMQVLVWDRPLLLTAAQ